MTEQAVTPLSDVKRQAVIRHILAATRHFVLAGGLDVTMDQLAEVSEISRSTLFRHFSTRENLLAAAFEAGMMNYREGLPDYEGDLHAWLRDTCAAAHRMNSTIGPGFFELASRSDLAPDLAAVEARRRADFGSVTAEVATTVWSAAGGRGPIPPEFANVVSVHLSPFFTAATVIDSAQNWQTAAELAYSAIIMAVTALTSQTRT